MQKIIKNKLSTQGRRIYGIALKKAKAHNLKFDNCMFGIVMDTKSGKYILRADKNKCCCIIGACMLNKPAFDAAEKSISTQVAELYGENRQYYEGVMDGFDNQQQLLKYNSDYLIGVHDGKIMAQRLGLR